MPIRPREMRAWTRGERALASTTIEGIATQVEVALGGVDDDAVYGRAGRHEWGYVEPGEGSQSRP